MARRYRAAIIGCGAIACGNDAEWIVDWQKTPPLTHAGAYKMNAASTLVAAADIDPCRLEQFGRDWQVTSLYADYKELLRKEKIDIVSICTPTALHAEIVMEASEQGVPAIFCEKPLASNPDAAAAALQLCERNGTVLAVNYFRRWNVTLEALAQRLSSGALGRIRRVNAYYTKGILNNGTHVVDLILWFVGRIQSIRALRVVRPYGDDLGVDALCVTETDVPCYLHACEQEDFNVLELDLLTDRGRIRVTQNGRVLERYGVRKDPHYRQYAVLDSDPEVTLTAWQDCLSRAVHDVTQSLATGTGPKCGGREACEALAVAAAIHASASGGGGAVPVYSAREAEPAAIGTKASSKRRDGQ